MDNLKDAFTVEITIALNSLINRHNYKELDSKTKKKIIKKILKCIINNQINSETKDAKNSL